MSTNKPKTPRWVWTLVKVAVAVCVVGWMLHKGFIRLDNLGKAAANWPLLVAALAALLLGTFLTSVRWGMLLRAQGIHVGALDLFSLTMTGFFFTLVAPGGLGGDAVKAYYVGRGRDKKAEAATTVFLDRFLGLGTMFLVAAVVIALDFGRLWDAKVEGLDRFGLPGGRVLVLLIAACMAGMLLFALLVVSKRVRSSGLLGKLSRFVPFRRTAARVYDAMHLYGDHPGALLGAAAVSIAAQVPLYLIYYLYGLAVGANIEFWHCVLIVPPAMVIRVLPICPGGAGQGAVAMALLFPLVGIAHLGGDIGAVGDAMFVILYLVGGLFFLLGKAGYSEARAAVESDASGGPS